MADFRAVPIPVDPRARAAWIQALPVEEQMWFLGAVAYAISRNLGMTEGEVYERAAREASDEGNPKDEIVDDVYERRSGALQWLEDSDEGKP